MDKIISFCEEHMFDADAVQAIVRGHPDGPELAVDIGEFRYEDWMDALPEGVREWVAGRPVTLNALRKTGEYRGADECWETLATVELLS